MLEANKSRFNPNLVSYDRLGWVDQLLNRNDYQNLWTASSQFLRILRDRLQLVPQTELDLGKVLVSPKRRVFKNLDPLYPKTELRVNNIETEYLNVQFTRQGTHPSMMLDGTFDQRGAVFTEMTTVLIGKNLIQEGILFENVFRIGSVMYAYVEFPRFDALDNFGYPIIYEKDLTEKITRPQAIKLFNLMSEEIQ